MLFHFCLFCFKLSKKARFAYNVVFKDWIYTYFSLNFKSSLKSSLKGFSYFSSMWLHEEKGISRLEIKKNFLFYLFNSLLKSSIFLIIEAFIKSISAFKDSTLTSISSLAYIKNLSK